MGTDRGTKSKLNAAVSRVMDEGDCGKMPRGNHQAARKYQWRGSVVIGGVAGGTAAC